VRVALLAGLLTSMAAFARVPPNDEIRRILTERIDQYRKSVGIVVGVIEPEGRRVVSYGRLNQGDERPLNGDTVFEIASITKVFTSLLLSDMVQRGEVALTDPVSKYLPPGAKVPERNGRQITLVDLATHTSGLPRDALNLQPTVVDWEAGYSEEKLYGFLASYQLKHDIGARFEYSNLGGGLLGIALARRAGMDYETLVRTRITEPLGMTSTSVTLSPDLSARAAIGHAARLSPAPYSNFRIFAGAGGLLSSVNDLLTFLAANLGYTKTPLAAAMTAQLEVHRPMTPPVARLVAGSWQVHLGWLSSSDKGVNVIWHNGRTLGFHSFIGFDPKARVGVVVLSNCGNDPGVDDIGMHLLNPAYPLLSGKALTPAPEFKEITVDAKVLDGYLGTYRFSKDDVITVTRKDNALYFEDLTDGYYPSSATSFFARLADARIEFRTDSRGRAVEFVFYGNGGVKHYKRVG
jgi:CubicO group peptidase (beta-lactamase class C family)